MILIHFDLASFAEGAVSDHGMPLGPLPADCINLVRWHCHSSGDHETSFYVLLPVSWKSREEPPSPSLGKASVIWYTDDVSLSLPEASNGGDVWVLNGKKWLIIDWDATRFAAHHRDCDVLVFGPPDLATDHQYSESMRVDETGQVVRFRRHYLDSPVSADPRPGPASFLVCAREHARAVVAHLVVHGWGLDSIGGLTRRFHIGWSDMSLRQPYPGILTGRPRAQQRQSKSARQTPSPPSASIRRDGRTMKIDATLLHDHKSGVTTGIGGPNGGIATTSKVNDLLSEHLVMGSAAFEDANAAQRNQATSARLNHTGSVPDSSAVLPGYDWTYRFTKRSMDIALSVTVLLLLLPFLLVVAVLVKLSSRGTVLFGHKRQGVGGTEFRCLKFRTMIEGADAMQAQLRSDNEVDGPQFKITKDPRLTRLGAWMQRYNVDELPQFINVLRGDMSLVGPRPSPDGENQFCPGWRRARLSVRPGITGLWQVLRLRDQPNSDFQEWIYYDLEYVRHRSFWLDWQILLHTPMAMFASKQLGRFAQRLEQRGICIHSARIPQNGSSPL